MNNIELLISDSNISHDEFFLVNNVLNEFYDMKEEINKLYIKRFCLIVRSAETIQKVKIQKL